MATETIVPREHIEAESRRKMAEIARMPSRGFDTERRRAEEIAELDALLDDYNQAG